MLRSMRGQKAIEGGEKNGKVRRRGSGRIDILEVVAAVFEEPEDKSVRGATGVGAP